MNTLVLESLKTGMKLRGKDSVNSVKEALNNDHLYSCSKTKSLVSEVVVEHRIKVYLESMEVKVNY